jgi:hypothetical protein
MNKINFFCNSFYSVLKDENTKGGIKIFWESDASGRGARIPFDGFPYTILGFQTRQCLHGPNRHKKQKSADDNEQVRLLFIFSQSVTEIKGVKVSFLLYFLIHLIK